MKYHMTFKNKNKKKKEEYWLVYQKKKKKKRGVLIRYSHLPFFDNLQWYSHLPRAGSPVQFYSTTILSVTIFFLNKYSCSTTASFQKKIIIIYNICWYAQHCILYFVDYSCILVCLSIKEYYTYTPQKGTNSWIRNFTLHF